MPHTIIIEPLYPWLEGQGISEEQLEAVENELEGRLIELTQSEGVATLVHTNVLLEALKAIDYNPWKDTNPVEFRKWLQSEVRKTGVKYWLIGADTLPLDEGDDDE